MATINIVGTGGIIEGNLGAANVIVNLDPALTLDGSADYLTATSATFRSADYRGAISAWIKTTSSAGQVILGAADTATDDYYMVMYLNAGKLYLDHKDSSLVYQLYVNETINDGSWHHVYVGSTGSSIVMYIDGVSKTVSVGSGSNNGDWFNDITASKLDNVSIGAYTRTGTSAYFNGSIADVRYFNDAVVADAPILASKIQVDDSLTSLQAIHHWKLNSSTISTSGVGDCVGSATAIDLTPTSIVAGSFDYDAYSVNVQKDGTTTDGNFTVTQGKVEGLSLSSVDFETGNTNTIGLASQAAETTHQTVACWLNPESVGGYRYFLGQESDKAYGFYNTNSLWVSTGSSRFSSGVDLTAGKWYHFATTWDGTTQKIYIDGVFAASATNDNRISIATIGGDIADDENWDGKIRDVRTYDYALSADQVASLYSGSYNVTPYKWWKLDEGHATAALANAVGAFSDSGTATAIHGQGDDFTDALASVNGTLDLDGLLTIEANGTLSAPRGNMTLAGTTAAMDNSGTFTHNSGTVTLDNGADVSQQINDTGSVDPVFYNLTHHRAANSYHMYLEENTTVEGTFTNTAGFMNLRATKKLTLGTDTSQGTYTTGWSGGGIRPAGTSDTTVYIYGKNQLYPAIMAAGSGEPIDWNNEAPNTQVNIKWLDYQTAAVTGGSGTLVTLDGDCEFDAVTVSSGDTLDLNGQRMELSGMLNGQVNDSASSGGQIWTSSGINFVAFTSDGSLTTTDYISTASSTHYLKPFPFRTVMANGGSGSAPSFGNYAPSIATTNFIMGSGTLNNIGQDASATGTMTVNNATIATGGVLTAGSATLSCAGDFTTSGGLIGKSALNLTGSQEVTGSDNLDEVATTNKFTVEGWFKASTDDDLRVIFSRGTSWASGNIYLYQNAAGNVLVSVKDVNSGVTLTSTTSGLADNKWHHAAATYDTATLKLYVDGKLEASVASTDGINTQTAGFKIGARETDGSNNFQGNIGRVSVWKNALSETLIRKMMFMDWTTMAADSDFTDSDAIGWWQFDEGTSTAVEDLSSQSNDGTLDTAAWAGAGTYTHGGTTKLKMTGTGTINYRDDALTLYDLEVTGATTLKGCDKTTADLRMNGNLTVSGSVASTASETIMILTDSSDKLFVPQALEFDGSNDYITVPDNSSLKFGDDSFSVAFWIKTSQTTSANAYIIHKAEDSAGAGDAWWGVSLDSAEKVHFQVDDGSAARDVLSSTVVNDNKWHHICAVYTKEASLKMYIDGTLETTTSHSLAIDSDSTSVLEIGRPTGVGTGSEYGDYYAGSLVDVKIYNAALSATEVGVLAENIIPNQATTDNLVAHWKLNEVGTSTSTTATDSAGSNNGTLTNFPSSPWYGNKATALANLYKLRCRQATTTLTIPELTTKRIFGETNGSTIKATSDLTVTEELEVGGSHTFNANGNTIACKNVDVNDTATFNLSNSTLNFSVTSSSDIFTMSASSTLLSGNTAINGYSSAAKTLAAFAPSGGFEVVGDVKHLLLDVDTDLTVIGAVIDCDISASGANIRQWHHTLDTQQLLDADEAGDDDLRLTKPALDNALELMTK